MALDYHGLHRILAGIPRGCRKSVCQVADQGQFHHRWHFAQLYRAPQTRYCVKWKSSEGKLILKVTDDTTVYDPCNHSNRTISSFIQCIKFKTYSSIFLNRFESLNLSLMQKMQNRRPDPPPSTAPQPAASGESSHPRAASPVPSSQTGPAAGGVKKKKPKKKK